MWDIVSVYWAVSGDEYRWQGILEEIMVSRDVEWGNPMVVVDVILFYLAKNFFFSTDSQC